MIRKISILGPACYKQTATLETEKNINLIYGLNGSGKSTLSEYLRNLNNPIYSNCAIEPILNTDTEEILVYNENYVQDVFYSSETQRGIFSLSKENSDARKKIDSATIELKDLSSKADKQSELLSKLSEEWETIKDSFYNRFWQIKKQYSGGDRVLEYCLEGLKGSKEALANYLINLPNPTEPIEYTIEELRDEIQRLNEFKGTQLPQFHYIEFNASEIETASIFREVITGNKNSRVANLIDKLQNSDWVKTGMNFDTNGICPFCQRPYTEDILTLLKEYFNEDYERALADIRNKGILYSSAIENLPSITFSQIAILSHLAMPFEQAINSYIDTLRSNLNKIREKYKSPSLIIELEDSSIRLKAVNDILSQANAIIENFNKRVSEISQELLLIKTKFWNLFRNKYAQSITDFTNQQSHYTKKNQEIKTIEKGFRDRMSIVRSCIEEEQKKIINIDDAIDHINSMLIDMGIIDFKIVKCDNEDGLYRIVRDNATKSIFRTLSEGERTIISVLYFIETCQGLLDKTSSHKKRIVVIDDPVSSLSNMYVFNIGRLIRSVFYPELVKDKESEQFIINPKFEQVFILTHSLYFFYEMTEISEEKRHASQSLFRVSKNEQGSKIEIMRYEHIQSDYHAYWMTIRDPDANPALIANCMRNIIEYFFNFVEKRDLNNVFNLEIFKQPKYQAFQRYINRESHSLGQNIYDFKEFDYAIFMDALKKVFTTMGYEKHYNKMMRIN
ncbi:AAA family ATPase [Phocaeicola vulgatus]|uniref:AAA family ATPase n=1 Tax=Phocaeicola vulgatus TaxID=821 RepID=A0A6I1B076_PHOVU|nr:AAA family ATPase [Phocaeicola vulgatus]KAB6608596.1 AAA family ATPase [Phocaeicola vulgatus]KAB6611813.1 AAA family ATPase [Phocaeicola vulgatus]KAB6616256.1 AAA family ATPase [Phocaeicola vulgatus]KAB6624032.1 AAA family ATPase [Phocaeicola vulgatus]